jgi:hypothetical protein
MKISAVEKVRVGVSGHMGLISQLGLELGVIFREILGYVCLLLRDRGKLKFECEIKCCCRQIMKSIKGAGSSYYAY